MMASLDARTQMSRQRVQNGAVLLPALYHGNNDVSPAGSTDRRGYYADEQSGRALQITEEDMLRSFRGSTPRGPNDLQSRQLLQEHLRNITDIVRKLSRDIQFLETRMRERDGATVGTQQSVKSLELQQAAGVTDLRARVVRCDTSIARLAADLRAATETTQALAARQQEQHGQISDRLRQIDAKIQEVTSAIDRAYSEQLNHLRQVETGSVQQLSGLDSRTKTMADELRSNLEVTRVSERAEREKFEAKLVAHVDKMLAQQDARTDKQDQRRDDDVTELRRQIAKLQEDLQKERDKNQKLRQSLHDSRILESTVRQQDDELTRLKRDLRGGFETVQDSIEEMKQVVEARRLLMEEQLRKEMSNIRKMVVLV